MKVTRLLLTVAFASAMLVCQATGQELQQPSSVQPSSLNYDYYYQDQEASLSDMVSSGGGGDCGCSDKSSCGDCCDPWRLFPGMGCWNITGWLDVGGTANEYSTPSRYNGPVTFNDRREGQMNQLYAILERPASDCDCTWDWGFRMDLLYGTDYIFTQQTGFETRRDGTPKWNSSAHYGLAMPQVYVEFARRNLSVKLGRFYTIIGHESVMAPANFFYSHAYTMQYGEPFTHTGGLVEWQYSDRVTVYAGLVNGWDRWDGLTNRVAFLGGATYTPCHGGYSLAGMFISGQEFDVTGTSMTDRTMYSMVFTWHLTDNLDYILQHDNGWHQDYFAPGIDAEWYGLNNYLLYTLNDCWQAGARFEWFRDDDGARVTGVRATNPYAGGSSGHFYEVALGLNWKPSPNMTVRPEVRFDWFDGAGPLPFNDGLSDDQVTAAVDFILHW